MGVFSEKGDCDVMGKSKGPMKGVLTCYEFVMWRFLLVAIVFLMKIRLRKGLQPPEIVGYSWSSPTFGYNIRP